MNSTHIPRFEPTSCGFKQTFGTTVDCGYLIVPENRCNPSGRRIRLAVAILRPSDGAPEPDPIVHLAGGPGEKILHFMAEEYDNFAINREVILFEQRGVGWGQPTLDCPDYTTAFLDLLDFDIDGRSVTAREAGEYAVEVLLRCAEALRPIAHITQNSIHDNGRTGIHLHRGGNTELAPPIVFDFDLQAGSMLGLTCANCTVEIFSDSSDEGQIYEGQTTADGAGTFAFNKGGAFLGPHLTATASDNDGNTSEFSLPTSGTASTLNLQQANDLPKTFLQPKESQELADNRIGTLFSGFGYGDNYDVGLYSQGLKRARASINSIEWIGVDWSRPELSIHPSHDEVFTRLADHGFVTTYVLSFWDKATYPDGVGVPCPRFKTEGEIQRYLEFVRFIVGHFKDRVQIYEVWNEPDNMDCPQGIEVEDYINLVQHVAPEIRKEYPEAKIQVGSTSGLIGPSSEAYLFGILESEVMPLVDVVAWHPFYSDSPEHSPEDCWAYPSLVQEIKSMASAHGFDGEYQADEMEWRTSENAPLDFPRTHSSTVAAKYHGRGILMHLGLDVGAGIGGEYYDQIPAIVNVVRNLSTLMAGAQPVDLPMQIQSSVTNTVSYTFSLPNDGHLVALWTDGVAVEDDPGVEATVILPSLSDQKVVGIDVLHGFEQKVQSSEEDGVVVIRPRHLYGCPDVDGGRAYGTRRRARHPSGLPLSLSAGG